MSSDASAPSTFTCEYTTYDYCCVQRLSCGSATWGSRTSCGTLPQATYYYTPCDGFLASAMIGAAALFDADSGLYVADFTFEGGQACFWGPPSGVTVSQACLDMWSYGTGGSSQCNEDAGPQPADFCAYLFPDGGP